MRYVAAGLFLILCAGCNEQATVRQADRYSLGRENVDVKLGPRFTALVDEYNASVLDYISFPTGQVAQRVFTGRPYCPWTIEVISSSLGGGVTYQISCVLSGPGRQTTLSAGGSGQAVVNWAKATTAAVEKSLNSLAVQARIYMQNAGSTSP